MADTPQRKQKSERAAHAGPRAADKSRGSPPRHASAATSSPIRCARSTSPTSRSIPARAFAACTTASSTTSATSARRCCCACTRSTRSRSRTATPRSPAGPMAAAVHSNVGLMHATMAIFNAWCDRMPVLVLGATGPVDAAKRRPWIDWIHTARDQGALVRDYTKWDDQPASPAAAREALLRAHGSPRRRRRARSTSTSTPACRKRALDGAAAAARRRALHAGRRLRGRRPSSSTRAATLLRRRQAARHPGRPRLARAKALGRRAWRSPKRSARASSPTSRSAPASRPTIRCTPARPRVWLDADAAAALRRRPTSS